MQYVSIFSGIYFLYLCRIISQYKLNSKCKPLDEFGKSIVLIRSIFFSLLIFYSNKSLNEEIILNKCRFIESKYFDKNDTFNLLFGIDADERGKVEIKYLREYKNCISTMTSETDIEEVYFTASIVASQWYLE